jgi:hypothetical protein
VTQRYGFLVQKALAEGKPDQHQLSLPEYVTEIIEPIFREEKRNHQ